MSDKKMFEYDKELNCPKPVTRTEAYLYQIVKNLQEISEKLSKDDEENELD